MTVSRQGTDRCMVFRLVLAKQFIDASATTLIPWTNYIAINCHFNDVQLLFSEVDITRVTTQLCLVKMILVRLGSIYPRLKNLTIFNYRFTTFREGDDVIVFKAETSLTVAEALTDDVARGIFTPSLRVSSRDNLGFGPAQFFGHGVKESRSLLLPVVTIIATATMPLRR